MFNHIFQFAIINIITKNNIYKNKYHPSLNNPPKIPQKPSRPNKSITTIIIRRIITKAIRNIA